MIAILFDVETTGLLLPSTAPIAKQPYIIELGVLKVDEHGAVLGKLEQLLNPGAEVVKGIDWKTITKINGITAADLVGKPSFAEFLPQLIDFFAAGAGHSRADLLLCHNSTFDVGMLKNELSRSGYDEFPWPLETVCTVSEYTPVFGFRPSLKVLYKKVLGKELEQTHRGGGDCEALLEVLVHDKFFQKAF